MNYSIIAGFGNNGELGFKGNLLWRLPEDLKSFKSLTMGKTMVMGRKTFESIGKALPGRETIILTRDESYSQEGCRILHSKNAVDDFCQNLDEVMIVGGGEIYSLFLNDTKKMYLSFVDFSGASDTFFPEWAQEEWQELSSVEFPRTEKTLAWDLKTFSRKS